MAISLLMGFDQGSWDEGSAAPGTGAGNNTTTTHSAGMSIRCAPADTFSIGSYRAAGGTSLALFQSARFYLLVNALAAANPAYIYSVVVPGMNRIQVVLNANGTLSVYALVSSVQTLRATSTNAFTASGTTWHRVEVDVQSNSSTSCRVNVDGVLWVTDTNNEGTRTGPATGCAVGAGSFSGSPTGIDLYFDDMICEDDTLVGGPYSADYNVRWLDAVSDNARGANWTGGAGGTTNLWDAVNNHAPVGTTSASATNTSQIKNAAKDATGNYDANVTDYTTAGVGASDTILAVQSQVNHAIDATGTQLSGAVVIVSNPSGQTEQSFDYGNNGAVTATVYPGTSGTPTWFTMPGPVTASPTVVLGTQPVVRVGRRTASKTTGCHVDYLGMYVAYQPAVTPPSTGGLLLAGGGYLLEQSSNFISLQ